MLIQPIASLNLNNKNNKPTFGQIRPEHLFIRTPGYNKDKKWANHVIKVIEDAKTQALNSTPFNDFIGSIAKGYGEYFKNLRDQFGVFRNGDSRQATFITKDGQYSNYRGTLINFALQNGEKGVLSNSYGQKLLCKEHTFVYNLSTTGEKVPLNTTMCFPNPETGDIGLYIESPHPIVVPKVLEEVGGIYKKILANKNELTSENIKVITKDIAKTHWLLSQVRPYRRGSAGIADAVAKSLFEAKGIQVSPYKYGVDPNLEAYGKSLDKYIELYENFFTKPPVPVESVIQEVKPKSFFQKLFG